MSDDIILGRASLSWDYRVTKRVVGDIALLEIREAYYDGTSSSEPRSWTERAIAPSGLTIEDLRAELERMLEALDKPVLDIDKPTV